MRNPQNKSGASIGPRGGWGDWRARKTKSIEKPRRNRAALKLTQPKKEEQK